MPAPVSIFNDVIGPVMRGPSSSHCAAALRIGRLARDLMNGVLTHVGVELDRQGALATTYYGQGSDMGLCGGLLGWDAADPRLPESRTALVESGVDIDVRVVDAGDPHPNTYRLTLANDDERHSLAAISTGGGMINVIEIDGFPLSIDGGYWETLASTADTELSLPPGIETSLGAEGVQLHRSESGLLLQVQSRHALDEDALTRSLPGRSWRWVRRLAPVLPVLSRRDVTVPFHTCAEMLQRENATPPPLWELAARYEAARGGLETEDVVARMRNIVRLLHRSVDEGIAGTEYADRVLPAQSPTLSRHLADGRLIDAGALNRMLLYVCALMEVKSSLGVIVAAPTAGACAALPGACLAYADSAGLDEDTVSKGMLAAGLIGAFIATASTFAAEVCGCQAECGAAAGMAAAALCDMAGGTALQSVAAASMALQNTIGLVCDPVANRVEVPCLGKNILAAANALSCANLALAGLDPVIPLDEVITAMDSAGRSLPRELCCTGLGGLSITPTSAAVAARLQRPDPPS